MRQDGSPPLYYLLLHGWIAVFGDSDLAVRSLSGLASLAALPLAWSVGRRVGGNRSVATASLLLLVASPWAIRYATETRMYSLLVLLVLLGAEALAWVHRRSGVLPVIAVALISGSLLLTHYWSVFLLAVVGAHLVWRVWRGRDRRVAVRGLIGIAAGGLFLIPWLPSMAFQLQHTGTPWAGRPDLGDLLGVVSGWAGSGGWAAPVLALAYWALALLGWGGRAGGYAAPGGITVALTGRQPGRRLAGLTAGTLVVAFLAGLLGHVGFVSRYTAVALVPFLLLLAIGVQALPNARWRTGVLAVLVVLGLTAGVGEAATQRTQAGAVADALADQAAPGDVVVYCPDQLGPAVYRLLRTTGLVQLAYPTGASPARVDWVDYAHRNNDAPLAAFAAAVEQRAGDHAIWLDYTDGYRTLGQSCSTLAYLFTSARSAGDVVVTSHSSTLEHEQLVRWPQPRTAGTVLP